MSSIRRWIGAGLRAGLRPLGFTLAPLRRRAEYIDATETITAAQAQGVSVATYVEQLWNEPGISEHVVQEMAGCASLAHCERVCEIGPGTGRFLERVLPRVSPTQYDIYELDDGWAEYLASRYPVTRQPTDGRTLAATPDSSCGLVHAHGVFIYLKLVAGFEYFQEMARVCAPDGYLVFDYYPDDYLTPELIREWLTFPDRYQVSIPRSLLLAFFADLGFSPVYGFRNRCYRGESEYVVLRRQR